jgi:hypothetical protein
MKKLTFLSLILLALFSCEDDEKSKTELLTGKTWKMTGYTVDPAYNYFGTLISDIFAQWDACDKDDIYSFKTDKTYTFEEGLTKCDPEDDQVYETGTWTFNADETVLVLTTEGETYNMTIVELSSGTLILTDQEQEEGIYYTYTLTFN